MMSALQCRAIARYCLWRSSRVRVLTLASAEATKDQQGVNSTDGHTLQLLLVVAERSSEYQYICARRCRLLPSTYIAVKTCNRFRLALLKYMIEQVHLFDKVGTMKLCFPEKERQKGRWVNRSMACSADDSRLPDSVGRKRGNLAVLPYCDMSTFTRSHLQLQLNCPLTV